MADTQNMEVQRDWVEISVPLGLEPDTDYVVQIRGSASVQFFDKVDNVAPSEGAGITAYPKEKGILKVELDGFIFARAVAGRGNAFIVVSEIPG